VIVHTIVYNVLYVRIRLPHDRRGGTEQFFHTLIFLMCMQEVRAF